MLAAGHVSAPFALRFFRVGHADLGLSTEEQQNLEKGVSRCRIGSIFDANVFHHAVY